MKPTPPVLSGGLVGHAFQLMKDRQGLLQKGFETLGPVFTIKMGNRRTAVLIGPDYHQTFFLETDKKLNWQEPYRFVNAGLGEITFPEPSVYMNFRPVTNEPLKGGKVAAATSTIQLEVQRWLDSMGEQGEIELTSEIVTLVQNVAAHALMGKAFRDQLGSEFWSLYRDISKSLDPVLPPHLPLPKFIRRDRARRKFHEILYPIIAERRANPDRYDDFLQDLVNAHCKDDSLADNETIVDIILGLMFAGHETTASQAARTIIQLLQHPDYLKLVQKEIAECLPPDRLMDAGVLSSLKHVFWAVQETTRMHPSTDILLRRVDEDIEAGEYRIPRGWNVMVASAIAQRLPDIFTEPDQYDPLRFSPDRAEDRKHRFAIIGFGGGIHKCAGMNFANNEMMVITSLLFQQFDLELVTQDPRTIRNMGVSRPEKTIIRYRRKLKSAEHSSVQQNGATEGCPYHSPAQ